MPIKEKVVHPRKAAAPLPWLVHGPGYPLLLIGLAVVLMLVIVLAAGVGPYNISYLHLFGLIRDWLGGEPLSQADKTTLAVFFNIRLARILLAGLVGLGLALAGAAFQGILLNPLADPFTLGVASGAAFGASLTLSLGVGTALWGSLGLVPFSAFVGAVAALGLVLALGAMAGGFQHGTLILAGVIVSAFLSSLISLMKFMFADSLSAIVFWIMGSFSARTWSHLFFALPYILLGSIILFVYARELNLLTLGDAPAQQLGLAVSRVRLILLLAASLITAGAVAVSGIIGFVGLIVPHLVRLLVGPDHRRLLPAAALTGAALLIAADTLARGLMPYGQEIPVGIITALLGGPFFCYLLKVTKGQAVLEVPGVRCQVLGVREIKEKFGGAGFPACATLGGCFCTTPVNMAATGCPMPGIEFEIKSENLEIFANNVILRARSNRRISKLTDPSLRSG